MNRKEKKLRCLAVIPARGGSKGVPRKNLRLLAGKPLIVYSIEVAKRCTSITDIVVSTEDEEIAEVSRRSGLEIPFMRPAYLAEDTTPMEPVVIHALQEWEKTKGVKMDCVALLEPTGPLRSSRCIEEAIRLWRETGADSIVSLMENDYPVNWLKKLEEGRVVPFCPDLPELFRRQDAQPTYKYNNAIFVVSRDILLKEKTLLGPDTRPLLMEPLESVDINSEWDFQLAEWLITQGKSG
jgi:CMP-N,N'-diacetyllegionaminic acid synthase